MKITVTLDAETVRFLKVLGKPAEVLQDLAAHAADGVRRPGAWERKWVSQCFGPEFQERLESDPDCDWRDRPATSLDSYGEEVRA